MTRPRPPQRLQVETVLNAPRKVFCVLRTCPLPRHAVHVSGALSGRAPDPLHREQVSKRLTEMLRSTPVAASSSVS